MAKAKATEIPQNGNGHNDSALVRSFKSARRVSTPIVAVETPDAAATIIILRRTLNEQAPVLVWDAAKGLRGVNVYGEAAFSALGVDPNATVNATETLLAMDGLPKSSVVFLHNFQRQLADTPTIQALWNLRDSFKLNQRTAVLLGPTFVLPAELAGDVIVLSEPLPTRDELGAVLDQLHKDVGLALPTDDARAAALDAVVGLAHYTSEQVMAMALRPDGIDVPNLWERKIKAIENTPGLTVYKPIAGDTSLDELKGLDNVVDYVKQLIAAEAFGAVVFLDEMDKSFAGGMAEHVGDSGVGKDQVGQVLCFMNDKKAIGVMFAGIAGTGKTQLAKAIANASGKPVIVMDLGGAKGGVVGQSETQIRNLLKVIDATAEGRVLVIGTANRTTIFTPEMNRRFRKQFFFDLPDAAARKAIWAVYAGKNGLTASQSAIPEGFDNGWTGAEIQAACEEAAMFGQTVVEAARYIIPQAVSAKATIATMRRESAGRFLSANKPGWYEVPVEPVPVVAQRAIDMSAN